ncbi:MAG: endonuclease/exonuclease/phosphatase family protein, partial [Bacteroidales bacterium]|nr:endonuclease/exonuclease/phosphatase family protein [Bacteroidales bacterium]
MRNIFILLVFVIVSVYAKAQESTEYRIACVAFYNLENLFDTINEEGVTDEEFTPEGKNTWTPARYLEKLDNMAIAISKIGVGEYTPDGAVLLGVCELENASVMEDIARTDALKDRNYKFVHYDSPYYRGMDVALFYQPKYFTVLSSASHELNIPEIENFNTRAQLVVSGILDGDTVHVIVNHWPSRSGGEKRSRPFRIAAADLSRYIADSLFNIYPNAKIIIMGDLNDDPTNKSVKKHLKTNKDIERVKKNEFYNPYESLHAKGIGSLGYRDSWNLFDQILISHALTGKDYSSYKFYQAKVFNEKFLIQQEGRFKGYPWRTYSYGAYIGGYSDHFPVLIYLVKQIK